MVMCEGRGSVMVMCEGRGSVMVMCEYVHAITKAVTNVALSSKA